MRILEAHSPPLISPPVLTLKSWDGDVWQDCPRWLRSPTATLKNPRRNQSAAPLWVAAAFLCPGVSFLRLTINSTGLNMSRESKKLGSHLKAA